MEEIWKDIPEWEGNYKISNLGKVKSLSRVVTNKRTITYSVKEKILKQGIRSGYLYVTLTIKNLEKKYSIHQLLAIVFLNHNPKDRNKIVDHKNNVKLDNRLENLQIITPRENSLKDYNKKGMTSKYIGVYFRSSRNKWIAKIQVNNKSKVLGSFINEYDAHIAYTNYAKSLNLYTP